MNESIKAYLVNEYSARAFTHSYIFGHAVGGMIYAARVMDARPLLPYIVSLDKASSKNGGTFSIKYKPNAEKWAMICAAAAEIRPICSVDYMEKLNAESKQNRGQIFERLAAESFGMKQMEAKNAKFTDCGDVVAEDGTHYQVKHDKATFTDERTLKNLQK